MALPVFSNGNFEITNASFSPNIAVVGDKIDFSITIKNVSGVNISSCYIIARFTCPADVEDGYGWIWPNIYLHGSEAYNQAAISWPSGASHTFTGFTVYSASNMDTREYILSNVGIFLQIVADKVFSHGGNSDYTPMPPVSLSDGGYLTVLSRRDNPILYFEAERAPTDESVSLSANLKLSGDADAATMNAHGYTASLYKGLESSGAADEGIPLNCTIEELLAGINSSMSVITEEFPNITGWLLKLVVTNGYETTSAVVSIPRAFANMHLSGKSTGGVAFGGFSTSEEGNPKAEFHYKIYPYAGIEGLGITYPKPNNQENNQWQDPTTGEEQFTGDYWIDGKPIYRRTATGWLGTTNADTQFQIIPRIETLVKLYGSFDVGAGNHFPVNHYWSSSWHGTVFVGDKGGTQNVLIANTSHKANIYVVIEFTKPD